MTLRRANSKSSRDTVPLPTIKPWLFNGFYSFCRYYLRQHFHAVAVDRRDLINSPVPDDASVIFFANHPGWWDPIIAIHLCKTCFSKRQFYAPIDAEALRKYKVFSKLGFYGIELHSLHGAADFLKTSRRIISEPNTSIWITPEGRFADPRDVSATLMPGLAHLAMQHDNLYLVPLAIEYTFWEERLPEALQKIGTPIFSGELQSLSKVDCLNHLTLKLRETQRELADAAIHRRCEVFEVQLSGKFGAFGFYDWLRRWRGSITGENIDVHHGSKLNS